MHGHDTLANMTQYRTNVVPPSATLVQHLSHIRPTNLGADCDGRSFILSSQRMRGQTESVRPAHAQYLPLSPGGACEVHLTLSVT